MLTSDDDAEVENGADVREAYLRLDVWLVVWNAGEHGSVVRDVSILSCGPRMDAADDVYVENAKLVVYADNASRAQVLEEDNVDIVCGIVGSVVGGRSLVVPRWFIAGLSGCLSCDPRRGGASGRRMSRAWWAYELRSPR